MSESLVKHDLYSQSGSVGRLAAAFLLGRLWVRFGWHFIQCQLMIASRQDDEDPSFKRLTDQESSLSEKVFGGICRRASTFPADTARLVELCNRFQNGFTAEQLKDAVTATLRKMELCQELEITDDCIGAFINEQYKAPLLEPLREMLNSSFDEVASRWFAVGIALERILCPSDNWRCLETPSAWRKKEELRYQLDDEGDFGDVVKTDSNGQNIRLLSYVCPPGRAKSDNAEDILAGCLEAAAGNRFSEEMSVLRSSLNLPAIWRELPPAELILPSLETAYEANGSVPDPDSGDHSGCDSARIESDLRDDEPIDRPTDPIAASATPRRIREPQSGAREALVAVECFSQAVLNSFQNEQDLVGFREARFDPKSRCLRRDGFTEVVKISRGKEAEFLLDLLRAGEGSVSHCEARESVATRLRDKIEPLRLEVSTPDATHGYFIIFN